MIHDYHSHYLINTGEKEFQGMFDSLPYSIPSKDYLPLLPWLCQQFKKQSSDLEEFDNPKDLVVRLRQLGSFEEIFGVQLKGD